MTTFRTATAARAWCALSDLALCIMVAASRRWIAAEDRLAGLDPSRAWRTGQRAIRLRAGHGHYRTMTYRRVTGPVLPGRAARTRGK